MLGAPCDGRSLKLDAVDSSLSIDDVRRIINWRDTLIWHMAGDTPLASESLSCLAQFLAQLAVRSLRIVERSIDLCVFCRNNHEPYEVYSTHKVKDRFGRVTCPILRQFTCPLCGETGDQAHTIRYCHKLSRHSIGTVMTSACQDSLRSIENGFNVTKNVKK